MIVSFEFHGDFNDRAIVTTVPFHVVLGHGKGKWHVLLALLESSELVGPHFSTASKHGDVEVLAIVVARSVVVAVGPITTDIKFEIATEFSVFGHEKALVKVGLHSEPKVDIDHAVFLFFAKFAFFGGLGVVVSEVGPCVSKPVVIHVHHRAVGTRLLRVFFSGLLCGHAVSLNGREQHGSEKDGEYGLSTHVYP